MYIGKISVSKQIQIQLRNKVRDQFSQIDVQLKRRFDLIPNLVETVKGYANHEKEVLTSVTEQRSKVANANSVAEKAEAEKENQLNHEEDELKKIDYYYEQFISWANEFDDSTPERKKMIICTLFKEITVGKGYEINCLMDSSYKQFLE